MRRVVVDYVLGKFVVRSLDDFNSLRSKGFGDVDLCGDNCLSIFEVIYLFEKGKVNVFFNDLEVDLEFLFRLFGKCSFKNFEYLVFKDLRSSGFIVRSGVKYGFCFRVYEKGDFFCKGHSLWLVDVVLEGKAFSFRSILGKNRVAHSTKKKLVFAVVDSDGAITYIENSWRKF